MFRCLQDAPNIGSPSGMGPRACALITATKVFIMGNHDRELSFPEVREVLVRRLCAAAPPGKATDVASRVTFEPWFFHVPDLLYVEHGQQYDSTCSYRDILHPMIPPDAKHAEELDMSFGSIAARKVLCRRDDQPLQ